MRRVLLTILLAVACFEAGVLFDRWLHRPIRVDGFVLRLTSDSSSAPPPRCFSDGSVPCPAPRAPCLSNCTPESEAGDGPDPDEPELKLRPIQGPCFFDPLNNQACQQET